MSARLLLDNSAWVRLSSAALSKRRAGEVADALEAGEIAVCVPFLLEAGYSARNLREHSELLSRLLALPFVGVDEAVERRALDAQRQLARAGHHRVPPVDLLLAALAERRRLGVLHCDRDYDVIASRTDLRFASHWLARRGTL